MQNFKAQYIFRGILFALSYLFLTWYLGTIIPFFGSEFLETTYYAVILAGFFAILFHTLWEVDIRINSEYEELLKNATLPIKFPKTFFFGVLLIIMTHKSFVIGGELKQLYNRNVALVTGFEQETNAVAGLYDNMWKTYSQTLNITNMSKDGFYTLVDIAFSARKDGQGLAWKWVVENQPLPYDQFAGMYAKLSDFVTSSRERYYQLELSRQAYVAEQHALLKTFPNNLYNSVFLKLDKIEYEYKILSDSTNQVLSTGVENLK